MAGAFEDFRTFLEGMDFSRPRKKMLFNATAVARMIRRKSGN
jgi:hypothetical protein